MKKKMILFAMMSTLALAVFAAGCALPAEDKLPAISQTGQIILRVNPEIAVHYDKEGLVTKMEGVNNDGKVIVDDTSDYVGRDSRDVVKNLVTQINEAGHFTADDDGTYNNITIHVAPGSYLPSEKFLDNITDDVRRTVDEMDLKGKVGVRNRGGDGRSDYDNDSRYGNSSRNNSNYSDSAYGDSNYNRPSVTTTPRANRRGNSGYNDSAYGNSNNNNSGYNNSGYNNSPAAAAPKPPATAAPKPPAPPPATAAPKPPAPPPANPAPPAPQPNRNNSNYGDSGYSGYGNSGYSGYGNS